MFRNYCKEYGKYNNGNSKALSTVRLATFENAEIDLFLRALDVLVGDNKISMLPRKQT